MHSTLIAADEAAQQLGITRRTLQNWTAAGTLPKPLRIGRRAYYQQGQIDTYLTALIKEQQ